MMANTLEQVVVQTWKFRDFATATYSDGTVELMVPTDGIVLAEKHGVNIEWVDGEDDDE